MNKSILFFSIFVYSTSIAQEDRIDTDRPDQTESAFTVPKKFFQWEAGFIFEHIDANNNSFAIPTSLFKYGVSRKFELRLETEFNSSVSKEIPQDNKLAGLQPVEIGFKASLWEEKGWVPKTSLIAHLGIPNLASDKYKADYLAPGFRFTLQNSISERVAIGYNVGAQWTGFDKNPIWLYTFAPGFDIGKRWYSYVEAFGFISRNQPPEHNADAGIAYYVTDNFKVDFSSGFGLNKAAPDYYVAVGASIRFK